MKLRVTKSNLYHNGKRCAVGDVITIKGDSVPKLYMGKVEAINEKGLTTDKDAGGDLSALQDENESLKQENEALRTENAELKAKVDGGGDTSTPTDTSDEADAKRKAWLIDEIEKLTGERPGSNSKLDTLEAKFEKAKLAEEK